jgi:hypothetical protein
MFTGIRRDEFHAKKVKDFRHAQLPKSWSFPGCRFMNILFFDQIPQG